jgi:hypothetical protein
LLFCLTGILIYNSGDTAALHDIQTFICHGRSLLGCNPCPAICVHRALHVALVLLNRVVKERHWIASKFSSGIATLQI